MKNAITLQTAKEIQLFISTYASRIELEMLTDCATIPEEDEEADHIALSPATRTEHGEPIPPDQLRRAADFLQRCINAERIDYSIMIDAGCEKGNAALCNGYATHGAVDRSKDCLLWVFLPLATNN